jgi:hypothetical protein
MEVGMRGEEGIDDVLVLFGEDAAGGIHQAAAGPQQPGRRGEDGGLLGGEFGHALRRLAPLEVGVAAQGAQPRTRRVDQHAVGLAVQALDPRVVLAREAGRMHVGQPGAGGARLQLGQALVGNVEGIQAPGRAHHGAEDQRLAAGAGTEIHHHFAALGRQQKAQQLRALVLHLDAAVEVGRMLLPGRAWSSGAGRAANTASAWRRCRRRQGVR